MFSSCKSKSGLTLIMKDFMNLIADSFAFERLESLYIIMLLYCANSLEPIDTLHLVGKF